jgi:hypothetical protein
MLALGSCRNSDDSAAVPRPRAYPRVAVYDSIYTAVTEDCPRLELNSACRISSANEGWYTAEYPDYNAMLYITVTHRQGAELREACDNRIQRIALNLGGNSAETFCFDTDSAEGRLIRSVESRQMPLQFYATDRSGWLVTGALFMPGVDQSAPLDSLRPIVNAIERDLRHTLTVITSR